MQATHPLPQVRANRDVPHGGDIALLLRSRRRAGASPFAGLAGHLLRRGTSHAKKAQHARAESMLVPSPAATLRAFSLTQREIDELVDPKHTPH
jgi:hypothetical protein